MSIRQLEVAGEGVYIAGIYVLYVTRQLYHSRPQWRYYGPTRKGFLTPSYRLAFTFCVNRWISKLYIPSRMSCFTFVYSQSIEG